MATELLSRPASKYNSIPTTPKPLDNKRIVELEQVPIQIEQNIEPNKLQESVQNGIQKFESHNQQQINQLYNSSELVFAKIIEDIKTQIKNNPAASKNISEYLNTGRTAKVDTNDTKSASFMSNEMFNNNELNKQVLSEASAENIAQLSTITKAGVKYQHHLSQKIITIQKIIDIAKQNNVEVDQTNINRFFDYYDSLEKQVTNSQTELAFAQQPYNGYTLGYNELVVNPTKYITSNFRVNPYYNTGDVVKSTEEDADVKEIGLVAERKVNSVMSSIDGIVMVIAGPNFSVLDTVSKIDSLSFYSDDKIDDKTKDKLVNLSYQIAYAAYQESLIKDYQMADPKKMRKHEVVPKSYIETVNNIKLSEKGLIVYQNDINQIEQNIDEIKVELAQNNEKITLLKSKTSKLDTSTQKSIAKIKKINDQLLLNISAMTKELQSLESLVNIKHQSINTLKHDAQSIYENYNPQGLAVPLILSPQGQIEVYKDGSKIQYSPDNYSDYSNKLDIDALQSEFDTLLIKHNIRVNSIQIKQNVNNPRVKEALNEGKYTGAIGINMDYSSEPTTLKHAIEMSLNIDDTTKTLSKQLRSN